MEAASQPKRELLDVVYPSQRTFVQATAHKYKYSERSSGSRATTQIPSPSLHPSLSHTHVSAARRLPIPHGSYNSCRRTTTQRALATLLAASSISSTLLRSLPPHSRWESVSRVVSAHQATFIHRARGFSRPRPESSRARTLGGWLTLSAGRQAAGCQFGLRLRDGFQQGSSLQLEGDSEADASPRCA